jgi:hypothetical protein
LNSVFSLPVHCITTVKTESPPPTSSYDGLRRVKPCRTPLFAVNFPATSSRMSHLDETRFHPGGLLPPHRLCSGQCTCTSLDALSDLPSGFFRVEYIIYPIDLVNRVVTIVVDNKGVALLQLARGCSLHAAEASSPQIRGKILWLRRSARRSFLGVVR